MPNDEGQVEGKSNDSAAISHSGRGYLWLPTLRAKQASICLPVSRGGAQRLVVALLADDHRTRSGRFSEVLWTEPAFVLWSVLKRADCGIGSIPYVFGLAEWLAQSGPGVLRGESADSQPFVGRSQPDFVELAARGIATSQLATTIAELRVPQEAALTQLLGLLVHAVEWLNLPAEESAGVLPAWLTEYFKAIKSKTARKAATAAGCVAEALAIISGKEPTAPAPPVEELRAYDLAEYRADVRQAWANPGDDDVVEVPLTQLIAKLVRLEQLETDFQRQLTAEKVESLKELAYGAGHEINNPLANISARAQTLLKEETDPEKRRKLAAINTQAFRAHEMIADMMLFARPPELQLERIDVRPLLRELFTELHQRVNGQHTELVLFDGDQPLWISADRAQLSIAIRALVVNACEALGRGGRIEIGAREGLFELSAMPGDSMRDAIEISVSDNGPGISSDAQQHLFDPFYSGREANRGIGFGLCKCWQIATSHGGRITVESQSGKGAQFGLIFPAIPD